jgi:hypothetical protein
VLSLTSSLFFALATAIPPISVFLFNYRKQNFRLFFPVALASLAVYILILVNVQLVDHKLRLELDSFDLNKDGSFSKEEQTVEQQIAMDNYVSDTGRKLALFTGAIFSVIYCGIFCSVLSTKIIRRLLFCIPNRT